MLTSTSCRSARPPVAKILTLVISLALLGLGLLSLQSCSLGRSVGLPQDHVLPDPTIPHQISQDMSIPVWAKQPDGKLVEEQITVTGGNWWLVSDELLRTPIPPPTPTTSP